MQREKAEKLIGKTLIHKKYGDVYIKEIMSYQEDKIIGELVETGEEKIFILSSNYFKSYEDIRFSKKFQEINKKKRTYKERDLNKYRNHPLLKKIDDEENKYKQLYSSKISEDDEDDD